MALAETVITKLQGLAERQEELTRLLSGILGARTVSRSLSALPKINRGS